MSNLTRIGSRRRNRTQQKVHRTEVVSDAKTGLKGMPERRTRIENERRRERESKRENSLRTYGFCWQRKPGNYHWREAGPMVWWVHVFVFECWKINETNGIRPKFSFLTSQLQNRTTGHESFASREKSWNHYTVEKNAYKGVTLLENETYQDKSDDRKVCAHVLCEQTTVYLETK